MNLSIITRKNNLVIALILGCMMPMTAVWAQSGQELFQSKCKVCHNIGKGRLVGPDLAGVDTRRTLAWLTKFIKSSQTLIKSGDAAAVAIFNEYNKIPMPDQALSDAQVKTIVDYIKSQGKGK